jgi:glucose/arabinose dehydrogenase
MTSRQSFTACAAAALVVLLSASIPAQQAPPPRDTSPQVLDVQGGKIRVVTVATGLFHPWGLAFVDANTILVTERNGKLRMIRNGTLLPDVVWTAPSPPAPPAPPTPPAQSAQGGRGQGQGQGQGQNDSLHFVTLHPKFAENQLVYVSYPKRDAKGFTLAIARGHLKGNALGDVEEIFVADAWETGGNLAGRIYFGPDGSLYVTVGDRDRLCCIGKDDTSLRMKAQQLDNHAGKTLRLRDDGTVPPDNPFVGRAGAKPEIFTYGHRNGYGLAIHPETGELWHAEIGPLGGDEVNILLPGHNYGWPVVSMGRNYTGTLVSDQPFAQPGMDNARMFWVPSISPSSIMFYTGDKFPRWKNNLFVGALTTQQLLRVAFNQPSQAERREGLLVPLRVRVRDVQQSPDGYIYVATEGASGGNNADGMVLKIEPAD